MNRRCFTLEVTGNLDIPEDTIDLFAFADEEDFWSTKIGEGETCDGVWCREDQTAELVVRPHNNLTVYGLLSTIKAEHETFGSISEETLVALTAVIKANK